MKKSRIVLLALVIVLIVYQKLGINPYVCQIIQMIAVNAILALGLNLVFGHTGQISIGQAGFYALGAYVSAILEVKLAVPFIIAWPSAVVFTCLVAYAIGKPILKLHGHYLAMATIAFGMIIESLATNWLPVTSGHDGIYIPVRQILGNLVVDNLFIIIVVATALLFIICENIEASRIGRAIRSVRENEMGAAAIGIEHSKYKVMMFVVAGAFSSVAGIFYAHMNTVITPEVFNPDIDDGGTRWDRKQPRCSVCSRDHHRVARALVWVCRVQHPRVRCVGVFGFSVCSPRFVWFHRTGGELNHTEETTWRCLK
jgi:branched-chain amino acid transport system permease protein